MARDYAKRRPRSVAKRHKAGKNNGKWLWLLPAIFALLLIVGVMHLLRQQIAITSKQNIVSSLPKKHGIASPKTMPQVKAMPEPNFVFYTSLQNSAPTLTEVKPNSQAPVKEVKTNDQEVAITATPNSQLVTKSSNKAPIIVTKLKQAPGVITKTSSQAPLTAGNKAQTEVSNKEAPTYVLQVFSLRNYEDAERFRAKLAQLGYNAAIQKIVNANVTWYRVNLGPYKTIAVAKSDQAKLHEQHVTSVLLTATK